MGALTVSMPNQWAISTAQPSGTGPTPPALQSAVIALDSGTSVGGGSGTPTAGNWLVCIAGWNQAAVPAATVGMGDDAHSFWRPGDVTQSLWAVSPASGNTRTSTWYTANLVRAAQDVYVAPSGLQAGVACLVIEVSGLGPWDTVTGIYSNYAAAATSLNLALGAPSAQALLIGAVCGDSDAVSQAFAPAGWTGLHTVTATNGTDHTCDAVLTSAYIVTSGSVSVNGTTSGASDLSGVVIGVLVSAPSPIPSSGVILDEGGGAILDEGGGDILDETGVTSLTGANPAWAGRTVLEFAPGAGFQTPPDQITWVTLNDSDAAPGATKRLWSWSDKSAIPYGLGQYQSSSGSTQLDNFDGNLSPSNPGGTWYSTALNQNMSFQSGVAPWTAQNGATLAQSSAQAYASSPAASALYSLQVTPGGSTALPGAVSEEDTAAAGDVYSASAWFYSAAGWSTGAQVAIRWLNGSGGTISTSTATALAIPAATWTQVTLTGQTAPALTAGAELIVQFAGTPSATPFYVAEAALVSGASAVTTGLLTAGVPVRLRLALGTYGGVTYNRWYVISRNITSWSEKRTPKSYRMYVEAGLTDTWATASSSCPTPYRGEVEQDNPYASWPCDDQPLAGGVLPTSLLNAAPGNANALNVILSPHGGTAQFFYSKAAASSSGYAAPSIPVYTVPADQGWMYGDPQSSPQSAQAGNPVTANPGSAAWQASGQAGTTGSYGWFLSCNDAGFPSLSGGVSVEAWFNYPFFGSGAALNPNTGSFSPLCQQPECALTILELATGSAPVAVLQLDTSGHLQLITYNGATGTSHAIYTTSDLRSGSWHHVAVKLTATTWTVYVNGSLTASVSGTATGMTPGWSWLVINGDMGSGGGGTTSGLVHGGNMSVSHVAVYPSLLPLSRIMAHYWAAITGFGLLPAPQNVAVQWFNTEAVSGVGVNSGYYALDGTAHSGTYNTSSGVSASAVVAAAAGSITSGPSAWSAAVDFHNTATPDDTLWVSWTGLAPSFDVYTASTIGGELEASGVCSSGESYTSGYGSGAAGAGVGHVSSGTGAAPPASPSSTGDTVAQRIERILGYGSLTVPMRAIDPAPLLVQAAVNIGGQQAGQNIQNIVSSDSGWWFTDNPGLLSYRSRPHLNSDTAVWQLGPDTGSGQIPYASDVGFRNDQQRVFTAITINPYSPDGASLPELTPSDAEAVDAAQAQYGARPLAVTSYLQSSTEAQSQADFLFEFYGTMRRGVEVITVDAATHPAAWALAVGVNMADVIEVTDMPFSAPVTEGTYRVSSVSRTIGGGANGNATTAKITLVLDPTPAGGYWA